MIPWRRHERGPADELLWQTRLRRGRCPRCGGGDWQGIDYEYDPEFGVEFPTGVWCDPRHGGCGYCDGYGDRGIRNNLLSGGWAEGPEEN